jgi:hypothetical protein
VVGIIVFVRFYNCSKNQDDLDKKTNNHIQLPVDYASNEGKKNFDYNFFIYFIFVIN